MSTNIATICLGANTPDAAERLCKGIQRAHSTRCNRQRNAPYPTAPEYVGETAPYLNQIAILATQLSHDELAERTKRYQAEIRANNPYAPLVNIDIDIVEWNGTIMRPCRCPRRLLPPRPRNAKVDVNLRIDGCLAFDQNLLIHRITQQSDIRVSKSFCNFAIISVQELAMTNLCK